MDVKFLERLLKEKGASEEEIKELLTFGMFNDLSNLVEEEEEDEDENG